MFRHDLYGHAHRGKIVYLLTMMISLLTTIYGKVVVRPFQLPG